MLLDFLKNLLVYLLYPQSEYTVVNTSVYAIEVVIIAYAIFLILRKIKIHVDKNLAISVFPFVVLGSSLRVLVDMNVLKTDIFAAPFSYISVAFITVAVLSIAALLQRKFKIPYFKTVAFIGTLLALFPLLIVITGIVNLYGAFLVAIFVLPWFILLKISKWSLENKIVSFIHIFDATTTFVSIKYFSYSELHVLPNLIIASFTPFSFVLLKVFAVCTILILIDRYCKEREFKNYLKLIIAVLGMATGTRDFFRMLALA